MTIYEFLFAPLFSPNPITCLLRFPFMPHFPLQKRCDLANDRIEREGCGRSSSSGGHVALVIATLFRSQRHSFFFDSFQEGKFLVLLEKYLVGHERSYKDPMLQRQIAGDMGNYRFYDAFGVVFFKANE